jgi:hypothetical protein
MPCVISGKVGIISPTGTFVPTNGAPVYLQPSRNDFQWTNDAGATWFTWEGDPNLKTTYPGAIQTTTNSTGDFSFSVPFSDTEVAFSGLAPTPALVWNIIDPNGPAGVKVFYGPTLAAIVAASKTLKQLLGLALPNTWQVATTAFTGYPLGLRRSGAVTFTSSSDTATATWPDIGTAAWKMSWSIHTDDSQPFAPSITKGSETNTGCSIVISALPAAGKSVVLDYEVRSA